MTTAMELNLIGDVVNIGNRHSSNLSQMHGQYMSEGGVVHNVFELSENLEYELGCRGQLGDTCRDVECSKLRDFLA